MRIYHLYSFFHLWINNSRCITTTTGATFYADKVFRVSIKLSEYIDYQKILIEFMSDNNLTVTEIKGLFNVNKNTLLGWINNGQVPLYSKWRSATKIMETYTESNIKKIKT